MVLAEQGSPCDSLYVVKEGLFQQSIKKEGASGVGSMLSFRSNDSELTPFAMGQFFGAAALTDEAAKWAGSVTAVGSGCKLLRLKKADMTELLGDLTTVMRDNFQKNVLGAITMFESLSASELAELLDAMKERRFQVTLTLARTVTVALALAPDPRPLTPGPNPNPQPQPGASRRATASSTRATRATPSTSSRAARCA